MNVWSGRSSTSPTENHIERSHQHHDFEKLVLSRVRLAAAHQNHHLTEMMAELSARVQVYMQTALTKYCQIIPSNTRRRCFHGCAYAPGFQEVARCDTYKNALKRASCIRSHGGCSRAYTDGTISTSSSGAAVVNPSDGTTLSFLLSHSHLQI